MPEKINLHELSVVDLNALSKAIETEIERRNAEAKRQALVQMKELAASVGMTIQEVMAYTAAKKTKGQPKYQNPTDPSQTWTGRGKRPAWIKAAVEQGKTLEDLKLPDVG